MAVKSLFKVLAKSNDRRPKGEKEKLIEKQKLPKRNCVPVIVGSEEEEDEKRFEVPIKYLACILSKLPDEVELNTDGPIRIDCPTDIFDATLEALKKNKILGVSCFH